MTNELDTFIAEHQSRIRAIAKDHPARAAALTDPRNYRTRKAVHRGYDGSRLGVTVSFVWPAGLDVSGSGDVSCLSNESEARRMIEGRCAALA